MGWRSLFIRDNEYIEFLINKKQLKVVKNNNDTYHIRIEDINFILIDSYNFKISGKALELLAYKNIPLVVTSSNTHLPIAQLLNPYSSHHLMGHYITIQSKLTKKEKLYLWKEIIALKLISQANLLGIKNKEFLDSLRDKKSYNSILGIEGSWAKIYWQELISKKFRRVSKVYRMKNSIENSFLNYTYAIIRARVSSAIVEHGLLPIFSIFHRRDYNQFALSDDLMEPYRWCADYLFKENIEMIENNNDIILSTELKKLALSVIHLRVYIPSQKREFNLDEAIRIGIRAFRDTIVNKNTSKLENLLCKLPL